MNLKDVDGGTLLDVAFASETPVEKMETKTFLDNMFITLGIFLITSQLFCAPTSWSRC